MDDLRLGWRSEDGCSQTRSEGDIDFLFKVLPSDKFDCTRYVGERVWCGRSIASLHH